jgi:hypothetical protein
MDSHGLSPKIDEHKPFADREYFAHATLFNGHIEELELVPIFFKALPELQVC